ncbi:MAG: hypothetical protein HC913_17575 [Microscillaceae bacterium]|nr:hypothetical protein [Microscillaceae bacterium]
MPRLLRRILIFFGIMAGVLLLLSIVLTYTYRQDAARQAKQYLEKILASRLTFASARLNYISKPGELTLSLREVQLRTPEGTIWLKAAQLRFGIQLYPLLRGQYVLNTCYLEEAEINLEIDAQGKNNFDQLHPDFAAVVGLKFKNQLQGLTFKNVRFRYQNQVSQENYSVLISTLKAEAPNRDWAKSSQWEAQLTDIILESAKKIYWQEKKASFKATLAYEAQRRSIRISPATFRLKETDFDLAGQYRLQSFEVHEIALRFGGKDQDLGPLLALLPEYYYREGQAFQVYGPLRFQGRWEGLWTRRQLPNFSLDFEAQNISLNSRHNVRRSIEQLSFRGNFNNGEQNGLRTASLRIENLQGILAQRRFKADFYLTNLQNPYLAFNLEAGIDLAYLHEFYPLRVFKKIKGLLGIKLNFDGEWQELMTDKSPEEKKITALGQIELAEVSAQAIEGGLDFENLSARLSLLNNTSTIQNLSGQAGNSDFQIQGQFQNLLAYFIFPQQILKLSGDLQARRIDLDALLQKNRPEPALSNPADPGSAYYFQLPEDWETHLNCQVDSLRFRKFVATKLRGNLVLKEKVLRTGNLSFNSAEGDWSLLAILNAQKDDFVRLDGRVLLQNAAVNQVLTSFENFSQTFVEAQNLKGLLQADVKFGFVFDRFLRLLGPTLVADIDCKVQNGQWQNWVLLQDVARKIQADELRNLAFEEMRNILQIRNQTLFIAETEIKGKRPLLSLIGRTTYDKGLDYTLKIPLRQALANPKASLVRIGPEEVVYFLSVKGKPQSFRVSFAEVPEQISLEDYWEREKKAYLNLFRKTSLDESPLFLPDTVRISY